MTDIPDVADCECGHPGSKHQDLDDARNAGRCIWHHSCGCDGFVPLESKASRIQRCQICGRSAHVGHPCPYLPRRQP